MQRDLTNATASRFPPLIDDCESQAVTAPEPGRSPPSRPGWMTAVAISVLAILATGGVIAYQTQEEPSASPRQAPALFIAPG